MEKKNSVRKPAVAGMFYPSEKSELHEIVTAFIEQKVPKFPRKLKALVVPHAGMIYSGIVAGKGYSILESQKNLFKKIIIIGPSHHALFSGACESGFSEWETPLGRVKIGSAIAELGKKGESHKLISVIPEAHSREHCIEVQLPFLQEVFGGLEFEVFPILCGEVDFRELAEELLPLLDDETLLVVSSDLSHYLPYEEAKKIDGIANESIPQLDLRRFLDSGDACGKLPILVLMEIAKRRGWTGFFVDYKNSGDTAGDKSAVVGYGCCAFCSTKTR